MVINKKRMPLYPDSGHPGFVHTNRIISKRLQFLVKKEVEIRYTLDDLKLLDSMLRGSSTRINISECLWEFFEYGEYDISEEDEHRSVSLSIYLLLFYRKAFLFMTCVPFTSVPKYIGTDMGVYAEWRLKINK
jgi:hypothetical protein